MTDLEQHLKMRVKFGSKMDNFILTNGMKFKIWHGTFEGTRRKRGLCFMNATHLAFENRDFIYCEGYMTTYDIPIEHAWCSTKDGLVVDPTIDNHNARIGEYFGVPFKYEYLRKTIFKNGVYSLLGYENKTLRPLLDGKVKNFRETINVQT